MISITDKELAEKLLQTFAGYDAPARSLAQEAARRLIDGAKGCENCKHYAPYQPADPESPCLTCISGLVEGVRFAPTNWESKEDSE